MKHFAIVSSMVSVLTLAISGLAMAVDPTYMDTTDPIKVGNTPIHSPGEFRGLEP